jgi:16S rRNA (adenine1518-N6/adenine1519-N6)-dimethyltransferase
MARQHLGQHFLADPYWREQIARAIGVSPYAPNVTRVPSGPGPANTCWIEIGPGHGELTEYLAATGAPVYAIELDRDLLGPLNRLQKQFPNLSVTHGDILESDLSAIAGGRRLRIYGSLPYYITSPILHHLFRFAACIDEIHIVIQTEVAERLAAPPGSKSFGYLSVATQLYARPELVFEIPHAAFNPPPEVGSSLVTLRLPGELSKLSLPITAASTQPGPAPANSGKFPFLAFVKLCFFKKRKTLVNNLRSISSPEKVRAELAALGVRPDTRAEQMSIANLAALYVSLQLPEVPSQIIPEI